MADVAKVITIIGSSPESFAKAADAAVQEAAKTVRGISGAHVVSMSALVEGDRIAMYRTTVDIAFAIDKAFGIKLPLEQWTQEVNDGKATTEQYFVLQNLCGRIDSLVSAKGA